jgi:Flp pilus assembly protein TadG
MTRFTARRGEEGGQIVVLFALAMIAIIAMVGLVLDGGSAFSQRRAEQSAADMAALAGANTILLNGDQTLATAAARTAASQNGFTHGSNGTVVTVTYDYTVGAKVKVDISALHRNNFVSVVGMPTWTVTTTATAKTGIPNTTSQGGPILFSIDSFGADGEPLGQYADEDNPFGFGETNGDIPTSPDDMAWTNYGTGNVNTSEVRAIIDGGLVIVKTINFGEYIGQHNNGNHTALYTEADTYLTGVNISAPVVDHNGNFQGWATFHVSYADKHNKKVYGYFVSPFQSQTLSVGCSNGTCPRYLGNYELHLVN